MSRQRTARQVARPRPAADCNVVPGTRGAVGVAALWRKFLLSIVPAAAFVCAANAEGLGVGQPMFWIAGASYGTIAELFRLAVLDVGEAAIEQTDAHLAYLGYAVAMQTFVALGVLHLVALAAKL